MKTISQNINDIFNKLSDLKELFRIGEKIVPILQSVIEFMKETIPLIENINISIADSTSKFPVAKDQINNVTNATELATTEILDLVDEITGKITETINDLENLSKLKNKKLELQKNLFEKLEDKSEEKKLFEEYCTLTESENKIDEFLELFKTMKDDAYRITLSLQVQDITAQQLASVNHLIETVHLKLNNLISDIEEADLQEHLTDIKSEIPLNTNFDPNASYINNQNRQNEVDEIINNHKEKTSQKEIDQLFRYDRK